MKILLNLLGMIKKVIKKTKKNILLIFTYYEVMFINIFKNKMTEYIWYCPRSSCNSIIIKTKDPILRRGSIYKCKRCNCQFSGDELIAHNKKNIKKYLDDVDNCLKC